MSQEEEVKSNGPLPIKYPFVGFSKEPFKPLDTSAETKRCFLYSNVLGFLTAATQNSLARDNRGAWAVVTKSGKLWGAIVGVSTTFGFSYCAISNLREKNDSINDYLAGAAAGAVLGSFSKSLAKTVGTSLGVGFIMGILHWAGGPGGFENSAFKARGDGIENPLLHKDHSNGEKQGLWEAVRRRPLSETKERLGEVAAKP